MPIKTQGDLPVKEILERENIFVMDEKRAMHQDIRPIQILILNLWRAMRRRILPSVILINFMKHLQT